MAQINSGTNPLLWVVILLVAVGGMFMYISAEDTEVKAVANDSTKAASIVGTTAGDTTTAASPGVLKLDSEILTLATTDNDSVAVIIADEDSTNFDTDKSKITLQLNAVVDSTTSSGNTTFTLKARNNTGISVILLNRTEAGTLKPRNPRPAS